MKTSCKWNMTKSQSWSNLSSSDLRPLRSICSFSNKSQVRRTLAKFGSIDTKKRINSTSTNTMNSCHWRARCKTSNYSMTIKKMKLRQSMTKSVYWSNRSVTCNSHTMRSWSWMRSSRDRSKPKIFWFSRFKRMSKLLWIGCVRTSLN